MNAGIPYGDGLEAWRATAPAPARDLDVDQGSLLRHHHPDRRGGGRVELAVGPNRGQDCPAELAAVLQADAVVDDVDIAGTTEHEADVVVVGGGGAGCAAALTAADGGASVLLVTKLALGDSNTVMAEGGIQAAVGRDDTLQRHFDDTVRGGHFAGDRRLAAAMVGDGPDVVRWLIAQGMGFDTTPGEGTGVELARKRAGGTTTPRVLSFRDLTGLELMRVLREAVVLHPGIRVADRSPVVELLTEPSGRCTGAVVRDLRREQLVVVRAGAVVLATGGAGRLHLSGSPTSNHYGATADGLVLAYRVGAPLVDVGSFQYHPTGLAWPAHLAGQLVSEAARSRGARLVNGHGERFVDELCARDVVASAIWRELAEGRGVLRHGCAGVWLDVPSLVAEQPGILDGELPALARLAARAGVDPLTEPLLVAPTLHYHNGGVVIDTDGASGVPGLWCAGEVAGGIHGRNRLMGNSLLDILAFGRRAGRSAAAAARRSRRVPAGLYHLPPWRRALSEAGLPAGVVAPVLFPLADREART
jgi:succinate dehydrogenase/fumarate reductase flavoprotein subunit